MSQHWFTNSRSRTVLYGSDKPTGGFFYTEFLRDEEVKGNGDDVAETGNTLTIRELILSLKENQNYILSPEEIDALLNDWATEPNPTQFQHNIGKMFGYDLSESLLRTENDILGYVNE